MKKLLSTLLFTLLIPTASAELTVSGCEHPFIDIAGHFAEDEICFLYQNGVVEGYSERNFSPDTEVTRAEFLKISLVNLGYTVYSVQSASFTDIAPGEWYYPFVTFARSKGFVSGYNDGSFHPNAPITRAEALSMAIQVAGITDYEVYNFESRFSDVSGDDWFAAAVMVGIEYGIIEGYGDGSFRPHNNSTRGEASVLSERIWKELY
ncbi:MAG: S-layer homology domain-containing protein [Candidatus Gracilibacteria bacterium]|jgi:hypothetical protein